MLALWRCRTWARRRWRICWPALTTAARRPRWLARFEALQKDQESLPVRIEAEEQPAQLLRESTWVEFVMRLGQTLAQTLAYAHQRNLMHLDVKPANIILTPDGQPILLDLDVARPPLAAGDAAVPWLGGTPAYMSPEQRQAINALMRNQPLPQAVDGLRSLFARHGALRSAGESAIWIIGRRRATCLA